MTTETEQTQLEFLRSELRLARDQERRLKREADQLRRILLTVAILADCRPMVEDLLRQQG